MPGVILVNPHSGPEETTPEELAAAFPGSVVREIHEREVEAQVEAAIRSAEDAEFVAVAGGDGTIRCAAAVVADTDLPLIPIPAGTRNHFAREVGIETVEDATRAPQGSRRQLDVGEVNGEVFVNNASIGIYPRLVRERRVHQRRFSKQIATVVAAWAQIRTMHKFNVTMDGEIYRTWMVFVGNGRYGKSLLDMAVRESLDDGVLDVRILLAAGRLSRLRVVLALAAGRVDKSPMAVFDELTEVEFVIDRERVDVALDGEVLPLAPPLHFRCRPKALTVLVPLAEDEDQSVASMSTL